MEYGRKAVDVFYRIQVLRASERAMERAACGAHQDLKPGLNTLATIVCLAPFVGFLGTVFGLFFDTFVGFDGERSAGLALVAGRISLACIPSAVGIFVGLQSLWAYRYLRGALDGFDREMANASLGLVNELALQSRRFRSVSPKESASTSLPYLEAYAPDPDADRRYARRVVATTVTLLFVMCCVEAAANLIVDTLPLASAMSSGIRSVAMTFCWSCLLTYPIWVDLLHRKSGGLMPIAAAVSLVWSVAGLIYPALRF